jgi:hypothetical protein
MKKNAATNTTKPSAAANHRVAIVSLAIVWFATTTTTTTAFAFSTKEAFGASNNDRRVPSRNSFRRPRVPVASSLSSGATMRTSPSTVRNAHSDNQNHNRNTIDDDDDDDEPLKSGENSSSGQNQLMKDTKDLVVGDWIVAKRDVPSLGIRAGAVYKLVSMYLKGGSTTSKGTTNALGVEVVPLQRYGDDEDRDDFAAYRRSNSYTKYLKVYNPRDHGSDSDKYSGGVVVTPDEIGLVSLRADWTEALYLAVPGFVWIFVAASFSNYYTDRYGGSFWDAFFRT